jgi:hypothetical protein
MRDETKSKNAEKALRDEIELRAYFKYCERGCVAGGDVEDWLAAEREVLAARALAAPEAASAASAAHGSRDPDPTRPNLREQRRLTQRQTTRRPGRGARAMR